MSKQNETVADICAEKRRTAVEIEKSANGNLNQFQRELIADLRAEADRIEAAWKREKATDEKSSPVGDAAKMREALVELTDKVLDYLHNGLIQLPLPIEEANAKAHAALSAPLRNCDVGTADEQYDRFYKFCHDERESCLGCPSFECKNCALAWALLPYEEGGAE